MAQDQQNAPVGSNGNGGVSALHRKIATGRAEHQARAMTLARAIRLSIAKIADETFDMAMAILSLRTQEVAGPELISIFDDAALLLLMDGPQKRRAAVIVDSVMVGALIQQQTMGKVMPATDETARAMTTTDAAICAPFVDAILERAESMPETEEDRRIIKGFRFGARAEDARLLHLSMDAALYTVIHLDIDVERGNRQGKITLCMPFIEPSLADADVDAFDKETDTAARTQTPKTLCDTMPSLPVSLSLVLARLKMPLNQISALNVGSELSLGSAKFDAVEICTIEGRKVGKGTLGQINGQRAVRIEHPEEPSNHLRRRSSDLDALEQPNLTPLGAITPKKVAVQDPMHIDPSLAEQVPDFADVAALPDLPDLPDMSDIPDFDDPLMRDVAEG